MEVRALQSMIDPFVVCTGGELICNLVTSRNPEANADYLFRAHNVIAELKSIQAGSFIEPFHRKLGNLVGKWHRERRLIVFGTTRIDSNRLPLECQNEMFAEMAEPLQKHIVLAANNQIKSTRKILNMPDAKGLLWVASDGNEDLQPNIVWYLLARILQKKKANGDPAYSSIDGIAYFNPRMPAEVPQTNMPALFWFNWCRKPAPELSKCVNMLSDAWPLYLSATYGLAVTKVKGTPEETRFYGVSPKLPKIKANYQ